MHEGIIKIVSDFGSLIDKIRTFRLILTKTLTLNFYPVGLFVKQFTLERVQEKWV
jgi:hypothetical protein